MFRAVKGLQKGYDREEVDQFFTHARQLYEQAPGEALNSDDVRSAGFSLVRGGYATAAVDAALDRLESAYVARSRSEFVSRHGQKAWMDHLGDQARTLYGRLGREDGERFAPPAGRRLGYSAAEVDETCQRLISYFDDGKPLTAAEIRNVTFRAARGRKAYQEDSVDAFCARAVEVLLGVE